VSPTAILAFRRCNLVGVLSQARVAPLLVSSIEGLFGTALHRFFERAQKREFNGLTESELLSELDSEITSAEKYVEGDWRYAGLLPLSTARDSAIRKKRAVRQALTISRMHSDISTVERIQEKNDARTSGGSPPNISKGSLMSEVYLENQKRGIAGRLDTLTRDEDDTLLVEDLKTGAVLDDTGEVSTRIQQQMAIYAGLVFEAYGSVPKARIREISGRLHDLSFSGDEVKSVLADASRDARQILKNCDPGEDSRRAPRALANPTEPLDSCRFCGYRPGCSAYLTHYMREFEKQDRFDCIGTIISIDSTSDSAINLTLQEFESDQSMNIELTGREAKRSPEVGEFLVGQLVGVFNVKPAFRKSGFQTRRNSAIFQYDPESLKSE